MKRCTFVIAQGGAGFSGLILYLATGFLDLVWGEEFVQVRGHFPMDSGTLQGGGGVLDL